MKLVIEVDLAKLERHDDLWRVLPDLLSDVGADAAEAGAVDGDVVVTAPAARPGQDSLVGRWRVTG